MPDSTTNGVKVLAQPTTTEKIVAGKDVFLYINYGENATEASPVWTLIGGQRSTGADMSVDEIDTSHKTSGGYKTYMAGLFGWKWSADGVYILDDDGLAAVKEAFYGRKTAEFRLVYKNSAGTIVEAQHGWGIVTGFNPNADHTDVATLSIEISGTGALTNETNPT